MAGAVDRLNSRRGKKLPSFQKLLKEQRAETNRGSVCCSKEDVELGIPVLTSYFPDTKVRGGLTDSILKLRSLS